MVQDCRFSGWESSQPMRWPPSLSFQSCHSSMCFPFTQLFVAKHQKMFFSSIITLFCPFSFTEEEMDEWGRCLPNLHPQSPSLSGSRLIHAVAPKHNTLSDWASLTVETCTDSVTLSSNLQETSRQTACWEKTKLWAIIMTPSQAVNETVFWIGWIHLSLMHLHTQARGGVAPSFYQK